MKSVSGAVSFVVGSILCGLLGFGDASGAAPSNNIGVYFDEEGTTVCSNPITDYPVTLTAYIILNDIPASYSIGGWEAKLDWDSNLIVSLNSLSGQALQMAQFPSFLVGLGEPLQSSPGLILAEINIIALGPGGVFLKPSDNPMIQGAESPIYVFGDDTNRFALMSYAYGDSSTACAAIGTECPESNEVINVPPESFGGDVDSQIILISKENSIYFPEGRGVATISDAAFSSPSLMDYFLNIGPFWLSQIVQTNTEVDLGKGDSIPLLGGNEAILIGFENPERVDEALAQLESLTDVVSVEKNQLVKIHGPKTSTIEPDDPAFEDQWGIQGGYGIGAQDAWSTETGEATVTVCVVDRGVRPDHPEFEGKRSGDTGFYVDHGAAIAGVIGANTDNSIGVAGVSWGCRLNFQYVPHPGTTSQFSWAIHDGYLAGPNVMNHSYGLAEGYSPIVHRVMMDGVRMGILHSISIGNDYLNGNPTSFPAGNGMNMEGYSQGNLVVGGINSNNERYYRSNTGPHIDHVGPAEDIVTLGNSADPNFLDLSEGTSYAAAHSSGAAAILLSVEPTLDGIDVQNILNLSAINIGVEGFDENTGWGRVYLPGAIDLLLNKDIDRFDWALSSPPHLGQLVDTVYDAQLEGFGEGCGLIENIDLNVYRFQTTFHFPEPYQTPPTVWPRVAGGTGLPPHPWYYFPFCEISNVSTESCLVTTYLYKRVDGPNNPFPDCATSEGWLSESYLAPFYPIVCCFTVLGDKAMPSHAPGDELHTPSSIEVIVAGPNPFNAKVDLIVQSDGANPATLFICDVSGKRLKVLGGIPPASGEVHFSWDGRDNQGGMLPSGLYFAVCESNGTRKSAKLVMLK